MKMFLQNRLTQRVLAVGAAVAAPVLAHADTAIDVSAQTSLISAQNANVLLIGAAVFGVVVSIKLYKWLRAAL